MPELVCGLFGLYPGSLSDSRGQQYQVLCSVLHYVQVHACSNQLGTTTTGTVQSRLHNLLQGVIALPVLAHQRSFSSCSSLNRVLPMSSSTSIHLTCAINAKSLQQTSSSQSPILFFLSSSLMRLCILLCQFHLVISHGSGPFAVPTPPCSTCTDTHEMSKSPLP